MATMIHPDTIAAPRETTKHHIGVLPARPDRRATHHFEADACHVSVQSGAPEACMLCGYVESSHLEFSGPERQEIVRLLGLREPQPLMRRTILRKLAAN